VHWEKSRVNNTTALWACLAKETYCCTGATTSTSLGLFGNLAIASSWAVGIMVAESIAACEVLATEQARVWFPSGICTMMFRAILANEGARTVIMEERVVTEPSETYD
jgi:hypothetical protein